MDTLHMGAPRSLCWNLEPLMPVNMPDTDTFMFKTFANIYLHVYFIVNFQTCLNHQSKIICQPGSTGREGSCNGSIVT